MFNKIVLLCSHVAMSKNNSLFNCIRRNGKKLAFATIFTLSSVTTIAHAATNVLCSYAPSQSVAVNHIAASIGGAGVGAEAILSTAGLTAVQHSSGYFIFTGASGYVSGTLGTAVLAPVLVTTSVIVGGSAIALELVCVPQNHPGFLKKIKQLPIAIHRTLLSANDKALDMRHSVSLKFLDLNDQAIDIRDSLVKAMF